MENDSKRGTMAEALSGTKTEQNLHTAFSAESQAYLRYRWFGKKAEQEGYQAVSQLFEKTADNEREHAEIWFRYLGGWSTTERNLEVAASGERFEWSTMYDEFEKTAREEGFDVIADLFAGVAQIEKRHEANYLREQEHLRTGTAFADNNAETKWICLNCGHIAVGKQPPAVCPVCSHPQGWFARKTGES